MNPNQYNIQSSETLSQFWGNSEMEEIYRINDLLEISIDAKRDFGTERVYMKKKKNTKGVSLTPSLFTALSGEEIAGNYLKQLESSVNLHMRKAL